MFESKINRGRANGYAPLDSGSKVPLSYLPPIQTPFNTGSFATTSSLNTISESIDGRVGDLEVWSSSLGETFATDLEVSIVSSSVAATIGIVSQATGLLSTSSFNQYTASISTASLVDRLNIIESETGSFATTGSNSFNGNQTITGSLNVSGSVAISQGIHNWEFGSDGIIKLNNGYGEIYADADSGSVRIGTAAQNVAPNAQIILGGFDQVLKIKSGPPLREWTFEGNGDFNLSGSINGVVNLATTGSNTFIGNQTISGGLTIINNGYSWSFESNGRTKIPNITFNSDRGTGMVGIKPEIGREFQIETSTTASSVGPWSFGLDGTLTAPAGANIMRVGNLVTTSSFNSYTASISTASLVTSISNLNSATSSYLISLSGAISSSSQLTSSFDTRYALSASFVSSSNLSSIQTITSASYAALTPVSGTLYIIIG